MSLLVRSVVTSLVVVAIGVGGFFGIRKPRVDPPKPPGPLVLGEAGLTATPFVTPSTHPIGDYLGVISGPQTAGGPDLGPSLRALANSDDEIAVRPNDYVGNGAQNHDQAFDLAGIWDCSPNAGTTKPYPNWSCDPGSITLNWTVSDAVAQQLADSGLGLFHRIGGEWGANGSRGELDQRGPKFNTQESDWYIKASILTAAHFAAFPGLTVRALNLGTEVSANFYDGSSDGFAAYLKWWSGSWYPAMRATFPTARIGGPGFIPKGFDSYSPTNQLYVWLKAQWEYKQANPTAVPPDFVDWHFFKDSPLDAVTLAAQTRAILDGTGVWDRVPWAGSGYFATVDQVVGAWMPSNGTPYAGTMLGAARNVAVQIAYQSTEIEESYLYRYQDLTTQAKMATLYGGGTAATPYPASYAWSMWATLHTNYPTVDGLLLPPDTAGLYGVHAHGPTGDAFLLANLGASAVSFGYTFPVEQYTDKAVVTLTTLTESGPPAVSTPVIVGTPIVVQSGGVVMVEVAR